ncbi:hypothetical protein SAMN04244573_03192, partial [Azotobacter beijerinckii]
MSFLPEWIASFLKDADWWARGPAWGGFVLAAWNAWRGRTSLCLALDGSQLEVANTSAHAVEVHRVGMVDANGRLSDAFVGDAVDSPKLPCKIDPRSTVHFELALAFTLFSEMERINHGRYGWYVRLSGGRLFSKPGRIRRFWWRLRSW